MAKAKKLLIISLSTIIILPLIILFIAMLVVNPNRYKYKIEAIASDSIKREVKIDGDLNWSLMPLGITLNNFRVANDPKFSAKNLVEAKSATLSLQLLPLLLHKTYQINTFVINDGIINLEKNKSEYTNWQSIVDEKQKATIISPNKDESTKSVLSNLFVIMLIKNIKITDTNINWKDPEKSVQIKNINFSGKNINFNKPFDLKGDFATSINANQTSVATKFDLTMDIANLLSSDNISANKIKADINELTFKLGGKSYPNHPKISLEGKSTIDVKNNLFEITKLDADINNLLLNINLTGSLDFDNPKIDGHIVIKKSNLYNSLSAFEINLPKQFYKKIQGNLKLSSKNKILNIDPIKLTLDEDLFSGSVNIDLSKSPYAITSNVSTGKLNLARFNDTKTTDTILSNFSTFLKYDNHRLTTNSKFNAYNGNAQLNNTVTLGSALPRFQGDFFINNFEAADLLKDKLDSKRFSGATDVRLNYSTIGKDANTLINNLNGHLKINITNGYINGADLNKIVNEVNDKVELNPLGIVNLATSILTNLIKPAHHNSELQERTKIVDLNATATITNGLLNNNDLLINAPLTKATGTGEINLVSKKINYRFVLADKNDKTNFNIPILIKGHLDNPHFSLDAVALLNSDLFKSIIKKNVNIKTINKNLKLDKVPVLKDLLEKL